MTKSIDEIRLLVDDMMRRKALAEAVDTIYMGDDSDYLSSLWTIVSLLGGDEAVALLESDPGEAAHKYSVTAPRTCCNTTYMQESDYQAHLYLCHPSGNTQSAIVLPPQDVPEVAKDLGSNAGIKCDMASGPCACGEWH